MVSSRPIIKTIIFLVGMVPVGAITLAIFQDRLGPDPAEGLAHVTGEWSLHFLLLTLILSSVSRLFPKRRLIQYRRMLGLFAFFYAVLHIIVYLFFFLALQWADLLLEVVERPYITVGFLAFLIMLALALTSNRWSMRRLGAAWVKLHRWIYAIGVLALVHVWWQVRSDYGDVLVYIGLFTILMAERFYWSFVKRRW